MALLLLLLFIVSSNTIIYAQIYTNTFQCYQNVTGAGEETTTRTTYPSFCEFSPSCTVPISTKTDDGSAINPLIMNDPHTFAPYIKTLNCGGSFASLFYLDYIVTTPAATLLDNPLDPPVPQCSYFINYTDCRQK